MRGNLNPQKMKKAMKQMGMEQEDIQANQVIIIQDDKKLVFNDPDVQKVNMMGQESYQVVGDPQPQDLDDDVDITADDIDTVKNKANVSEKEARQALEETDGDIAKAIINLK